FFAAREAMDATLKATRPGGDRKVGVVWHTQGSGKSLTMLFYAGQVIRHAAMKNPTVVVITDRNDLDNQLFGQFARCRDLIRQDPVQAEDRDHLQSLLKVAGGGVVFTTIQKFLPEERGERFPMLSDRENIVVIADEAHRSQYGFRARVTDGAISAGFAQHLRDALPNASFIGFTGTPIELTDKSTRAVFGDYISVYDIQRAVEDKATVPIYYEGRFAKLDLDSHGKEIIDEEFDEATENEEAFRKEKLKSKWARMEAIIGASGRIELIAKDIVEHFEQRTDRLQGKAMIVCMSRRICVELYAALRKLRPAWHDDDPFQGAMKVIMTGSSADPKDWQPHIHSKDQLRDLADNFKDAEHPLRLVIVRDMWLTGFDAPSVHTMYVDKPMKGHGLMQAIARVNRVWRDKPGGLVVDYIGLAEALQQAVKNYTESGGKGQTTIDMAEAISVMKEKLEICRGIFHGFDVDAFLNGNAAKRIQMLPAAADFILAQKEGRDRLANAVLALSKAHALCSADPEARAVADEVAFFEAVKVTVVKYTLGKAKPQAELDVAIRQIVSKAVAAEGVIDIFRAAGMSTPDITILSDSFLADVKAMPQKNLAAELLNKLLHDEVRALRKKNLVKSDLFSSKLEQAIARYRSRAIQTVEVIEELLAIAKALQEARAQGKELNLSEEEEAFFDALAANKSAVEVMGDQKLAFLAREVADVIRKNVTIDWTMKEQVRAKLRTAVKRKLRQHGYPPDLQEKAVDTVIKQAELLATDWTG
ncbi:MAG: type I restriction endonuclease subunit R, partial [Deltaproteobacteria bacterium]|nr:type I restriction endonuclease subunit R [Deltaproteobacteria bacterium]